MNLKTEIIQSIEPLQPILERWRELAMGQPFLQPDGLLAWWQCASREQEILHVVVVRDEEFQIRGIAPCYLDRATRTVRFLGDGPNGFGECGLVVDDRLYDESVPAAFATAFVEHSKAKDGWRTLHLESMDACDRNMHRFLIAMQSQGSKLHSCNHCVAHLVEPLTGWTLAIDAQTKSTRDRITEARKRLDLLRVRWVNDRIDLDEYLPILRELHQKQAKASGGEGRFSNSGFESLIREWASVHLENNQLQAFTLWQGQRPIAAEFGIRFWDRWFCQLGGTEPEVQELDPLSLSNLVILRDAERFGIRSIQFLNGYQPSAFLRGSPKYLADWELSTPTWRGFLRHCMVECKAQTRFLYRKIMKQA